MKSKEIIWDDSNVARIWNYYASNPSYNSQYFSYHSGAYILDYAKKFIRINGNILDFGCGPCFLISYLLRWISKGEIFGLDFSKDSIDFVNEKYRDHLFFGKAVWTKSLPSPYKAESMDIIISVEVIEHLNDKQLENMFVETRRLLKRSGVLIVTRPNEEDLEANKTICPECGCIFHGWQHTRSWNAQELKSWLERYDYKPKVVRPCFFQSRKARLLNWGIALGKKLLGKSSSMPQPHLLAIAEKHV